LTAFLLEHRLLVGIFIGLILILGLFEAWARSRKLPSIVAAKAVNWMNHEQALLLDLRSPQIFAAGHILGALNINLDELARHPKLKKNKAPVIILATTEKDSAQAFRVLQTMGISRLALLEGGLSAWTNSGLPLTKV